MYGIWLQANAVQHSGWTEADYQATANGVWEREEGSRFTVWDCMSTLKPLLDLEDSDMKRSRDDPEIIDSDFLTEGRVGQ